MTLTLPALPAIDLQQLQQELSTAVSPLPVVKPLLKRLEQESFAYFRSTLDAISLVHHRALLIDQILHSLWQHNNLPESGLSLVAVGGYGRGELHPHSDIDVLLLCHDEDTLNEHGESLQRFLTLLWDLKLDVGHSVRTLNECHQEAEKDLTIITNLMESRVIAGDQPLHQQLMHNIQPHKLWPAQQYFEAKWAELKERHRKHNDSEYNLEPNVKNSPGALRDIQTISWVTMRHFGEGSLHSLQQAGFLTEFECSRLEKSLQFLWQVRYALHMLAGREEDRLLFDLQREIATLLGFSDDKNTLGVEAFMKQYYRNQLSTTELCNLLMLHFNEDYMKDGEHQDIEDLNEHFRLVNGYLQANDLSLFAREPHWLIGVFVLMARTPQAKGIQSDTIRAIRDHRYSIDEAFRTNAHNNRLFMELIASHSCVARELSRMLRYGILGRYLPDFGHIIGMMEHDLFHIYTVDEHSLRMIRFLRQLRFGEDRERFPIASRLIHKVQKKEVLYLTALLHDSGKHEDGDHTLNSGAIAARFALQHQLRNTDRHMLEWLCANHLMMSTASQRLDLNNPDDIHQFACSVSDLVHLDMLYLISVADIVSTNPNQWTGWRAEQMNELYINTQAALRRGLGNPINKQEWIEEIQQEAIKQLAQQGLSEQRVREIWGQPGDDYFLREGTDNIVWHALEIEAHGQSTQPLVSIRQTSDRQFEGATQIFIFMKDQINLFAATTATLDQLNLNIQDARIMTSENEKNAVDTYIVLDENYQPIDDPDRIAHIRQTLIQALADPTHYSTIIRRRTPRMLKQFKVETRVTMSNDPAQQRTVLEVIAADRPGLLARMGAIFAEHGVQMQTAKILTEGERVSDIFYILDSNGLPFSDVEQCQQLKEAIIQGLDAQVEAQSAV